MSVLPPVISASQPPEELSPTPTRISYVNGRVQSITLRKCKLVVTRDGFSREFIFDQDAVHIGTMEDNDLVLPDDTVSRNHCRIYRDGDSYLLTDLESTNGTFINRVRIKEAYLRSDNIIHVGQTEIRFEPIDEQVSVVPSDKTRYGELIGRNAKMREIYTILEKISPTDATIIIEGETGTGKEVVARTIHQQSRRREGPFIVFDCGAVPENLIESELFGHEKGSFTGAISTRQGVFELAHGGTVFLDELGELALELQPKLLRVLEQREVRRIGGAKPLKVDVRVVAATNRKLEQEVKAGRFREDLFYRLSVVRVLLPSLRERKEDLALLVRHFLRNGQYNKTREGTLRVGEITPAALECLMTHDWPGNVRELHNVVERAVSFANNDQIQVEDLPPHIIGKVAGLGGAAGGGGAGGAEYAGTFKDAKERWVASFERDYLLGLLKKANFNISAAAREADIDRKYFRKLMRKYEIRTDDLDEEADD